MAKITMPMRREIIEDFAKAIAERKTQGPKPTTGVISFRNDEADKVERMVYHVPVELLLFRKDNGRISSDVLSYEKHNGRLDEKSSEAQSVLAKFLEDKDKEKTAELESSIEHDNQREPAIITCDGFLINGNRRKMVLERLYRRTKDSKFQRMKVVILPGKNDPGGPPSMLEIEQIENRYQLQSDGKADYYDFDKALSMQRKMDLGMTLVAQLKDDPKYATLSEKDFKRALKQVEEDYLEPLKCIDEYLEQLDRVNLYDTISMGINDRQGRWQAFVDYSGLNQKLNDPRKRAELHIEEREVGKIKQAAFNIIRKREISDVPGINKLHQLIRELPKWLQNLDAKKEIIKLADLPTTVPEKERRDSKGKEYDERELDRIWGELNKEPFIRHLKKASHLFNYKEERELPLNLLQAALDKLTHKDMDTKSISIFDLEKGMHLTQKIKEHATRLEKEFYRHQKNADTLRGKSNDEDS